MDTPQGPDPDVDEQFARIVAGWDEPDPTGGSASRPPPRPAPGHPEEPAGPTPGTPSGPPTPPGLGPDQPPVAAGGIPVGDGDTPTTWRGHDPPQVQEHFEPPDPALPSPRDATYWLSVLGMVGGPLVAIWAAVFSGNPDPGWMVVVGVLMTFAGFGLLVMRGSMDRDPGDDGARV